jgi:hypothetical protein
MPFFINFKSTTIRRQAFHGKFDYSSQSKAVISHGFNQLLFESKCDASRKVNF